MNQGITKQSYPVDFLQMILSGMVRDVPTCQGEINGCRKWWGGGCSHSPPCIKETLQHTYTIIIAI